MHLIDSLWFFVLIACASIATPGPAVLLALKNGGTFGANAAVWSSLGNILGLIVISTVSAWGLSAVLLTSTWLFWVVKVVGAIYLGYIGLKILRVPSPAAQSVQPLAQACPSEKRPINLVKPRLRPTRTQLCWQGFFVAVSNPKAIFFFSALYPQFLNPYDPLVLQFLVLTTTFIFLSFTGLMIYAFIASKTRVALGSSYVAYWLKRLAGLLFILMAISLLNWRPGDGK